MKFLRLPALKSEKGIPYTDVHLKRLEDAGKFPRRVKVSAGVVAWIEEEIDTWQRERVAQSRGGTTAKIDDEAVVDQASA